MDLFARTMDWGYKKGLKDIRKQIRRTIEKKRLVFLGDDNVLYIDRQGKRGTYSFDQMAEIAIEVGGWKGQMVQLGITHQDIVNILVEEYAKNKKEAK